MKNSSRCMLRIFRKHIPAVDLFKGNESKSVFVQDNSCDTRACLENHFRNLQAPLCGIFYPHSVAVARYAALIRIKSPTNWDSQLTKSLFQTRSRQG